MREEKRSRLSCGIRLQFPKRPFGLVMNKNEHKKPLIKTKVAPKFQNRANLIGFHSKLMKTHQYQKHTFVLNEVHFEENKSRSLIAKLNEVLKKTLQNSGAALPKHEQNTPKISFETVRDLKK